MRYILVFFLSEDVQTSCACSTQVGLLLPFGVAVALNGSGVFFFQYGGGVMVLPQDKRAAHRPILLPYIDTAISVHGC